MTQDEANHLRNCHIYCWGDLTPITCFYYSLRDYLRAMVDMLNSVYQTNQEDGYWLGMDDDKSLFCHKLDVLFTIQLRKDVVFFKEGDAPLEVVSDYNTALTEINKVILPLLDRRNAPFRPDDFTINGVKQ